MHMHHEDHVLSALLGAYMEDTAAFMRQASHETLAAMDASFSVLRAVQCAGNPLLAKKVDALGVAACDMIDAMLPTADRSPREMPELVRAHEARATALRQELADAVCVAA